MERNFIFGYGSIINDVSRQKTRNIVAYPFSSGSDLRHVGGFNDDAVAVTLRSRRFRRSWCFRSSTGFTALGLMPIAREGGNEGCLPSAAGTETGEEEEGGIFGVLFPVNDEELASFDLREVNYHKVLLAVDEIDVLPQFGCAAASERASSLKNLLSSDSEAAASVRIWTYIPDTSHMLPPDPEHPVLTTYLDICLMGCYEWAAAGMYRTETERLSADSQHLAAQRADSTGASSHQRCTSAGTALMRQFLTTTHGWGEYYLDDTPMSRRPWLHRPHFRVIDAALRQCAEHVNFAARMHSEDYAASRLSILRGLWGVPARASLFVGREGELEVLHQHLTALSSAGDAVGAGNTSNGNKGVLVAEVVGQAGIGKSSFAAEYCWRYGCDATASSTGSSKHRLTATPAAATNDCSASFYGLVVWLRAETLATLAEDMRAFAYDMGMMHHSSTSGSGGKESEDNSSSSSGGDRAKIGGGSGSGVTIEDTIIIQEVHRRLSQSPCRWLMVFDNVEDVSLIENYVPKLQTQQSTKGSKLEGSKDNSSDGFRGDLRLNLASLKIDEGPQQDEDNGDEFEDDDDNEEDEEEIGQRFETSGDEQISGEALDRQIVGDKRSKTAEVGNNSPVDFISPLAKFMSKNKRAFGFDAAGGGRILITSRVKVSPQSYAKLRLDCCYSINLTCFSADESLAYLSRYLQAEGSTKQLGDASLSDTAVSQLAHRLGHLPLALSVAAAYIIQCDVSVDEYLKRLDNILAAEVGKNLFKLRNKERNQRELADAGLEDLGIDEFSSSSGGDTDDSKEMTDSLSSFDTIATSLSMTLRRIAMQSPMGFRVLCCVSFLYTDNISKRLVKHLLSKLVLITRENSCHLPYSASEDSGLSRTDDAAVVANLAGLQPALQEGRNSIDGNRSANEMTLTINVRDILQHSVAVFFMSSSVLLIMNKLGLARILVGTRGQSVIRGGLTTGAYDDSSVAFAESILNATACSVCTAAVLLFALKMNNDNQRENCNVQAAKATLANSGVDPPSNTDGAGDSSERVNVAVESIDIDAECDRIWHILKQFSLLHVQRLGNASDHSGDSTTAGPAGSIHRLQQTIIRMICDNNDSNSVCSSEEDLTSNLVPKVTVPQYINSCIQALHQQWHYSMFDARTWLLCADLLPHVETLYLHIIQRKHLFSQVENFKNNDAQLHQYSPRIVLQLVSILTDSGCYSATSSSHFLTSQRLLHCACTLFYNTFIYSVSGDCSKPTAAAGAISRGFSPKNLYGMRDAHSVRANILHTVGKVHRYQGHLQSAELMLGLALQLKYQLLVALLQEEGEESLLVLPIEPSKPVVEIAMQIEQMCSLTAESSRSFGAATPPHGEAEPFATNLPKVKPDEVPQKALSTFSSISSTLHELGVLSMRVKCLSVAKLLFRVALRVKHLSRANGTEKMPADSRSRESSTESDYGRNVPSGLSMEPTIESKIQLRIAEAATYHQLGVLAISCRKYDEAERFLLKALMLEYGKYGGENDDEDLISDSPVRSGGMRRIVSSGQGLGMGLSVSSSMLAEMPLSSNLGFNFIMKITGGGSEVHDKLSNDASEVRTSSNMVAKAATLQQLGRLWLRKGSGRSNSAGQVNQKVDGENNIGTSKLAECEALLRQSLKLFEEVYGCIRVKDVAHVNLASVRHQLGVVLCHRNQFNLAKEHALTALRIREAICRYESGSSGSSGDKKLSGDSEMSDEASIASRGSGNINAQMEILQEIQLLGKISYSLCKVSMSKIGKGEPNNASLTPTAIGSNLSPKATPDGASSGNKQIPAVTYNGLLSTVEQAMMYYARQRWTAKELLAEHYLQEHKVLMAKKAPLSPSSPQIKLAGLGKKRDSTRLSVMLAESAKKKGRSNDDYNAILSLLFHPEDIVSILTPVDLDNSEKVRAPKRSESVERILDRSLPTAEMNTGPRAALENRSSNMKHASVETLFNYWVDADEHVLKLLTMHRELSSLIMEGQVLKGAIQKEGCDMRHESQWHSAERGNGTPRHNKQYLTPSSVLAKLRLIVGCSGTIAKSFSARVALIAKYYPEMFATLAEKQLDLLVKSPLEEKFKALTTQKVSEDEEVLGVLLNEYNVYVEEYTTELAAAKVTKTTISLPAPREELLPGLKRGTSSGTVASNTVVGIFNKIKRRSSWASDSTGKGSTETQVSGVPPSSLKISATFVALLFEFRNGLREIAVKYKAPKRKKKQSPLGDAEAIQSNQSEKGEGSIMRFLGDLTAFHAATSLKFNTLAAAKGSIGQVGGEANTSDESEAVADIGLTLEDEEDLDGAEVCVFLDGEKKAKNILQFSLQKLNLIVAGIRSSESNPQAGAASNDRPSQEQLQQELQKELFALSDELRDRIQVQLNNNQVVSDESFGAMKTGAKL